MKIFSTKADLVAASLTAGQLTSTKGYTTAGDGGGATYLIKTAVDYGGTPDEAKDLTLANGNIAALNIDTVPTLKQLGITDLVFEGDSITEGNTIANFKYSEWIRDLSFLENSSITTYNYAIGGAQIPAGTGFGSTDNNITYRYTNSIVPSHIPKNTAIHLLIGTNDLDPVYGNRSASTVIADITTYVSTAKAAGFKVILGTILPRKTSVSGWTNTVDLARLAVNTAILNGTCGADYVVDYAKFMTNTWDTSTFQDGIHPTQLGSKQIAEHLNAQLDLGLPSTHEYGYTLHNAQFNGRLLGNTESYFENGSEYMKTTIGSDNGFSTGFVHMIDLNEATADVGRWQWSAGFGNGLQLDAVNDNNSSNNPIMLFNRDAYSGSGGTGLTDNYDIGFRGRMHSFSDGYFQAGTAFNEINLGHFNGSGAGYLISKNINGGIGADEAYMELMQHSDSSTRINFINDAVSSSNVALRIYRSGTSPISFNVNSPLSPEVDNSYSLGGVSNRWSVVYAATGTINTSDEREKTFLSIEDAEKAAALEIKANMRKFKWNSAIESKGDSARIHFGVAAQQVKVIMDSHGLDAHDYGFFCYDEWEAKDDDVWGHIPAGNRYGIRYEELLSFIISAM